MFLSPLATAALGLVVGGVFLAVQAVLGVAYGLATRGQTLTADLDRFARSLETDGLFFSLSILASSLVCIPLTLAFAGRGGQLPALEYVALRRVRAAPFCRWLLILALLIPAAKLASAALGRPLVPGILKDLYCSVLWPPLFWIAMAGAAPFFEEILCRGFLFTGFEPSRLGPSGAIVLTALVWAGAHAYQYGWYQIAWIFAAGLLLGAARHRTKSLWPCIAMHALMKIAVTAQAARG